MQYAELGSQLGRARSIRIVVHRVVVWLPVSVSSMDGTLTGSQKSSLEAIECLGIESVVDGFGA
jgi:hypothetical protein